MNGERRKRYSMVSHGRTFTALFGKAVWRHKLPNLLALSSSLLTLSFTSPCYPLKMAADSPHSAQSKNKPLIMSNSGSSDSEDDDFVPEDSCQPSNKTTAATRISGTSGKEVRAKAENVMSNAGSDEDDSDDEERGTGIGLRNDDEIDADELEALKRERAELVAAAGGEDRLGKRRRLAHPSGLHTADSTIASDEAQSLRARAAAEWEAIKGSEAVPSTTEAAAGTSAERGPQGTEASSSKAASDGEEMISVPTTYKFAGEVHTTTRSLPRSHPEAIKYLSESATKTAAPAASASPSTSAPTSSSATIPTTSAAATRPPPPGPRRKKGSSLAAMSAAATAKPTKINTLEKSKLDWDQFKGDTSKLSRQELDELENQTRGGGKGLGDMKGYLERRDFLDRVKDRTGQS